MRWCERTVQGDRDLQLTDSRLPQLGAHIEASEVVARPGEVRRERDRLQQQPLSTAPPPRRELVLALEPQRPIGARRVPLEGMVVLLIIMPGWYMGDGA